MKNGPDSKRILSETQNYILRHESSELLHKPSGHIFHLGEHYGDPAGGVIAADETWCATVGDGILLYMIEGAHIDGGYENPDALWTGFRFWNKDPAVQRLSFAQPEDLEWLRSKSKDLSVFVEEISSPGTTTIEFRLDPNSDYASFWQLDIQTKAIKKIR